jgi:hypothetical protein
MIGKQSFRGAKYKTDIFHYAILIANSGQFAQLLTYIS